MNLKQTMKFPLLTPGQKNEGKNCPRGNLRIYFFLNPKHTGKNKPTHLQQLQNVPKAGLHVLDSELGWQ